MEPELCGYSEVAVDGLTWMDRESSKGDGATYSLGDDKPGNYFYATINIEHKSNARLSVTYESLVTDLFYFEVSYKS